MATAPLPSNRQAEYRSVRVTITTFSLRYPAITEALSLLPAETVIDGEIVALDQSGRPSFNLLQNYGSSQSPVIYYVFDMMVLAGKDVTGETLDSPTRVARTQGAAEAGGADPVFSRTAGPPFLMSQ